MKFWSYPDNEIRILYIRLKRLVKGYLQPVAQRVDNNLKPQLSMTVRTSDLKLPAPKNLPEGYYLVNYQPVLNSAWRSLINESDEFSELSEDAFYLAVLDQLIPGGGGLIAFRGKLTACASINFADSSRLTATLNYVLTHPAHRRNGLGGMTMGIALQAAQRCRIETIQLYTDDARLTAIKAYIKLGFSPFYEPDDLEMKTRWEVIYTKLL